MCRKCLITLALAVFIINPCFGITITVDDDGPADFDNIQDAIDYSWPGDVVIVSPGFYSSTYFVGMPITVRSLNPDDSSVVAATVIQGTVFFEYGENNDSVLSGLTITNGGIVCRGSSPTITKNIIRDCSRSGYGGGVYGDNASPTITYNIIKDNSVSGTIEGTNATAAYGGAIYNCDGLISHNIIVDNEAVAEGFKGVSWRKACAYGGGLYGCDGIISNNVIARNISETQVLGDGGQGGGLCNCNAIVKNNIITSNTTRADGVVEGEGGGIYGDCQNTYNNVWDNSVDDFGGDAYPGIGTISKDPHFADTDDFHLQSEEGRFVPSSSSWVSDDFTSRCIDAGDPGDVVGIEPNPNGGKINMGAYGGTNEASKSPSGIIEPVCTSVLLGDTNNDCRVDMFDFVIMASEWLNCNLDPQSACWE